MSLVPKRAENVVSVPDIERDAREDPFSQGWKYFVFRPPVSGMKGGVSLRCSQRTQSKPSNQGCAFISLMLHRRFWGFFFRRLFTRLIAFSERIGVSGYISGCVVIAFNVSCGVLHRKGYRPVNMLNNRIPNDHQSTSAPYPSVLCTKISGAMYARVPQVCRDTFSSVSITLANPKSVKFACL